MVSKFNLLILEYAASCCEAFALKLLFKVRSLSARAVSTNGTSAQIAREGSQLSARMGVRVPAFRVLIAGDEERVRICVCGAGANMLGRAVRGRAGSLWISIRDMRATIM
jgi:hypothetical protein